MNDVKPQARKRVITGWRQLERRKTEIRNHNSRRIPQAAVVLPLVKA